MTRRRKDFGKSSISINGQVVVTSSATAKLLVGSVVGAKSGQIICNKRWRDVGGTLWPLIPSPSPPFQPFIQLVTAFVVNSLPSISHTSPRSTTPCSCQHARGGNDDWECVLLQVHCVQPPARHAEAKAHLQGTSRLGLSTISCRYGRRHLVG